MYNKIFKHLNIVETFSILSTTITIFIDTAIAGIFLPNVALDAMGLCNPLLFLIATLTGAFSIGARIECGKSISNNDYEQGSKYFASIITFCVLGALIIATITSAFASPLAILLGAGKNEIISQTVVSYLHGYCIGVPLFALQFMLSTFLTMDNNRQCIFVANITMIISDLVLDLVNVFFWKMGMFGMGLATSISYLLMSIILLYPYLKKNTIFQFKLSWIKISMAVDTLVQGSTYVVRHVSKSFKMYFINLLLLSTNIPNVVAISSILLSFGNVFEAPGTAMSKNSLLLSKIFSEQKNKNRLTELLLIIIKQSAVVNGLITVIVFAFAPLLLRCMLLKENVIFDETTFAMRLFFTYLIPWTIVGCICNFMQGVGKTKEAYIFIFIHFSIAPIVALLFLVQFTLTYIWLYPCLGALFVAFLIIIYLRISSLPIVPNYPESNVCFEYEASSGKENVICEKLNEFLLGQEISDNKKDIVLRFLLESINAYSKNNNKIPHTVFRILKKIEDDAFELQYINDGPICKKIIPIEGINYSPALSVNNLYMEVK